MNRQYLSPKYNLIFKTLPRLYSLKKEILTQEEIIVIVIEEITRPSRLTFRFLKIIALFMPINQHFAELQGASILLVDDEPEITDVVQGILEGTGVSFFFARGIESAKKIIKTNSLHLALIDIVLRDGSGLDLIRLLNRDYPDVSLVAITGFADSSMALSLEQAGVQTVLTKPFSASQLRFTLCKEIIRRNSAINQGMERAEAAKECEGGLVGDSDYIQALREKILVLSQSDIPVLIEGPTGTGKEIIAHAIHRQGQHGGKDMIIVNSSAIPEHLEESEFFGHTKGAFTGAVEEKKGILKCADNSTLFLDEVGELSLRMQAKLLRALDGHEFSRVGETSPQRTNFRLISATNRPLWEMIQNGAFREDFYFRLKSGTIGTKPLKQHREDVPRLTRHFMFKFGEEHNRLFSITKDALELLVAYDWPGNIRELRNAVESLCTITMKTKLITKETISMVIACPTGNSRPTEITFSMHKLDFEKNYYVSLLTKHGGNIAMAAREAGIHRPNLSKKLKLLGIHAADFK